MRRTARQITKCHDNTCVDSELRERNVGLATFPLQSREEDDFLQLLLKSDDTLKAFSLSKEKCRQRFCEITLQCAQKR